MMMDVAYDFSLTELASRTLQSLRVFRSEERRVG